MRVTVQDVETVCKALADATRLRILSLLVEGEVCVCEIHDTLRLPQPTVSRHLAYLRRSGLVESRREGTWVHYRMAALDPVVQAVVQAAAHALSHVAASGTDRRRFEREAGRRLPAVQAPMASCCSPR